MNQVASPLSIFHFTGERLPQPTAAASSVDLRPALFAGFRDLSRARHDFPVVLADTGPLAVVSLTDLTDQVLRDIAPGGKDGKTVRRQILALEREIRHAVAGGKPQRLSTLWDTAQQRLVAAAGSERDTLEGNLASARAALPCDGLVLGYDGALPAALIRHVWLAEQATRSRRLGDRIDRLRQRLANILQLDAMGTGKAWETSCLQDSIGVTHRTQFDFRAMSQVLRTAPAGNPLPEVRRRRIRAALETLSAQHFAPAAGSPRRIYRYEFDDCRNAIDAFNKRLPAMAKLVRAMAIAELEIANRYQPQSHDHYFDGFDTDSLRPEDIVQFPGYLVQLKHGAATAEQQGLLFGILARGLPFKILLQTDDPMGAPDGASGPLQKAVSAERLAEMALAFDESFVLQASGAALYRMRDFLSRSLSGHQTAFIAIYSGAGGANPYLKAAAATESRAFPCFFSDPATEEAGGRISLQGNPQPDLDWPVHVLDYEDSALARQSLSTAFTYADLSASDGGCEKHVAVVSTEDWDESMVPLDQYLDLPADKAEERLPYVLLIDGDNRLKRAVVDQRLCEATRRCHKRWQRLQQRAGIKEMHLQATLEDERRAWQDEREQLLSARAPLQAREESTAPPPSRDDAPTVAETAGKSPAAAAEPGPAEERSSDEPWIESIRCTSCNECTDLNNRLFAYDEDQRAYVADPDAGTYRELVEAAESCQVAIIHPGKPRNTAEPGLDELMKRAEPFM